MVKTDESRPAQTLGLMSASQASRCDLSRSSVHGRRERQGLGEGAIADSKFNIQDKCEHEAGEAGIRGSGRYEFKGVGTVFGHCARAEFPLF